jgi:hypothetical protein
MVMVFTRKGGEKVNQLVKELDSCVAANSEAQLRGFVTVMGEDQAEVKNSAKAIIEKSGAKMIPVAISDSPNGPANYRLDPEADVTIIVANESQVVASHSFAADKVDVAAVIKEVTKTIN